MQQLREPWFFFRRKETKIAQIQIKIWIFYYFVFVGNIKVADKRTESFLKEMDIVTEKWKESKWNTWMQGFCRKKH